MVSPGRTGIRNPRPTVRRSFTVHLINYQGRQPRTFRPNLPLVLTRNPSYSCSIGFANRTGKSIIQCQGATNLNRRTRPVGSC